MSKKKAQQRHARKRFAERYGVVFDPRLERDFIQIIQSGDARFVEKQSNRVSLFDITMGEEVFRVVYDKERKTIVTVLPKEALTEDQNGTGDY